MEDDRGMINEVEGVQNLSGRDVELHEEIDFGLCGAGGVNGSDESGVLRTTFLVCD